MIYLAVFIPLAVVLAAGVVLVLRDDPAPVPWWMRPGGEKWRPGRPLPWWASCTVAWHPGTGTGHRVRPL